MASFAAAPFAHLNNAPLVNSASGFQPQFTAPEGHPLHLRGYLPSRSTLVALDGRAGAPIAPLGAPASTLGGNARRIPLDPVVRGAASLRLRSVELPLSFTQFSAARGNTSFAVDANASTGAGGTPAAPIPDGNYTPEELVVAFRDKLVDATGGTVGEGDPVGLTAAFPSSYTDYRGVVVTDGPKRVVITNVSETTDFTVLFTSDASSGALQRALPASQLGWSLGFRAPLYVVPAGGSVTAEAGVSVQPLRSVLVRLGGGGGLRDGFQASQAGETVAKILLPPSELFGSDSATSANRRQGTMLCATEVNGLLLSGTRVFREQGGGIISPAHGGAELRHLDVELLDEFGRPLDLQGDTFSLTVEIVHG